MTRQLLRVTAHRLWGGVLVLWGALTVTFLALRAAPGDPVDTVLGPQVGASPQLRERISAELGLADPWWLQYLRSLVRPLTGDLGRSYQLAQDVGDVLASQLGPTAQLALAATGLAAAIAVVTATATAGRGGAVAAWVSGGELLAVSAPLFWVGLLLLSVFSFQLRWLPAAGAGGVAGLVLPAVTLALPLGGVMAQVLRGALDRTLEQPYVTTLRARGLSEVAVRLRHCLRHGAVPLITMGGWLVGDLLTGTVLVETVFARPGIGRTLVTAVIAKDFPVVTAVVLLAALLFLVINLLVDLVSLVVDPRLRQPGRAREAAR
ncbi:ABC transporter permease [Goodfellowiella coeruleoviolacea]|uniref:Peptide/nickel transport system permease protein n=1 Tax=Goodfellowiella coeruleoviolacea TaxID=334858 RepID=A0AAE3KIV5_9PSEU|nr:ABC transporter permease [Goodfellowiella coeruleoviolacea]MCP2167794.1 peptide/nickel transport system permease protein [Goodfellowiella coeruleoviolacea]